MNIISKYLKDLCSQDLKKELLGEGNHGKVYKFTSDNLVVKSIPSTSVKDIDECIQNVKYKAMDKITYSYNNAILCEINNIPNDVVNYEDFNRWFNKQYIEDDDYTLNPSNITEVALSIVASELDTINFIKIDGYDNCKDEVLLVMEKVDTTLNKLFENLYDSFNNEREINAVLIQLIHAVYTLHLNKINHNDLHLANIGIIYVNESTSYKNKLLRDYDYLRYEFEDFHIDIKTSDMKYLVKILDFGDAVKYSDPVILNRYIMYISDFADYFNYVYDWICIFSNDSRNNWSKLWLQTKAYFLQMKFILNDEVGDAKCIQQFKLWWIANADRLNDNIENSVSNMLFNMKNDGAQRLETLEFNSDDFEEIENAIENNDNAKILEYIKNDTFKIAKLLNISVINYDLVKSRLSTNFDLRTLNDRPETVFELIKQPFIKKLISVDFHSNYLVIGK
jgi:serine/threonine protein kinase